MQSTVPPYADGIWHVVYSLYNVCILFSSILRVQSVDLLVKLRISCLVHFHCSRQLMDLLLSFSDAISGSEVLSFQRLSLVCDLQTVRARLEIAGARCPQWIVFSTPSPAINCMRTPIRNLPPQITDELEVPQICVNMDLKAYLDYRCHFHNTGKAHRPRFRYAVVF